MPGWLRAWAGNCCRLPDVGAVSRHILKYRLISCNRNRLRADMNKDMSPRYKEPDYDQPI